MAVEAVGEIFTSIFRFLFRVFTEVILEFLLKGTGYCVCRPFSKNVNPDGLKVFITGFAFWILMYIVAVQVFNYVRVDKCLDSGGSYNYQTKTCVFQS